ncbi:Fur family transcriptional regulator [Desulfonauticus submarinus]
MNLPKGKRLTKQRQIILKTLKKVKTHPTADEVYDMVRKELPKISLGTVYRNLEIMSEMGIIQKLELAGHQKRFDGNPEPHLHIRCLECGKVVDVDLDVDVNCDQEYIAGFLLKGYRIEFVGICSECQKLGQRSSRQDLLT